MSPLSVTQGRWGSWECEQTAGGWPSCSRCDFGTNRYGAQGRIPASQHLSATTQARSWPGALPIPDYDLTNRMPRTWASRCVLAQAAPPACCPFRFVCSQHVPRRKTRPTLSPLGVQGKDFAETSTCPAPLHSPAV